MELKALYGTATRRVIKRPFGEGRAFAFDVQLRCCSRSDMRRLGQRTVQQVWDVKARQYLDRTDLEQVRSFLLEECLVGWEGLTAAKVEVLCNLEHRQNGADPSATVVPFSRENADFILQEAIGFQDWCLNEVTAVAGELELLEAEQKKTSTTT